MPYYVLARDEGKGSSTWRDLRDILPSVPSAPSPTPVAAPAPPPPVAPPAPVAVPAPSGPATAGKTPINKQTKGTFNVPVSSLSVAHSVQFTLDGSYEVVIAAPSDPTSYLFPVTFECVDRSDQSATAVFRFGNSLDAQGNKAIEFQALDSEFVVPQGGYFTLIGSPGGWRILGGSGFTLLP